MTDPVKPTIEKVTLSYIPLTLNSSDPESYPFAYVDNLWDVVLQGSSLAALTECIGQFDQHTINELLAAMILQLMPQPSTHQDFTDDFNEDFN